MPKEEKKLSKEELMKELLNRYEQKKFINDPITLMIIDDYIRKLELELMMLLK